MVRFRIAVVAAALIAGGACTSTEGLIGGDPLDAGGADGGDGDTGTSTDGGSTNDATTQADADAGFTSMYRTEVLADSPLLYWRLGETLGSSAANEVDAASGTYIGGIALGQPGAIAGDPDLAVDFKGAGRVFVDDARLAFSDKAPFTLEAWVKPHTITTQFRRLFSRERSDESPYGGYSVHVQSGSTAFVRFSDSGGGDTAEETQMLPLEVWSHLVATFDGVEMRLFINAKIEAVESGTIRSSPLVDMPFTVGADSRYGSSRLDAVIDEVAVYDKALSAARVTAHYQAGIAK